MHLCTVSMQYHTVVLLTVPILEILPATPRARVVRLDLTGHDFGYAAGQAVLIGNEGAPKRRPYSIAGAPEEAARDLRLELLVGVEADGKPKGLLTLEPGVRVDLEGPLGSFTMPTSPDERRFVFIAGGTGIAPLRAMLHHALRIPHDSVGVFYSARTPDEFAYEAELQALAREGRIELRQTVTRGEHAGWSGARGRFGRIELQPLVHDPATLCFLCGPPALVEDLKSVVAELGIPKQRIKVEEW